MKALLVLAAGLALAACSDNDRAPTAKDAKILADCNPRSYLWVDAAGHHYVGITQGMLYPVDDTATLSQVCPRMKQP